MNDKKSDHSSANPNDYFPKIKSVKDNMGNMVIDPVYAQHVQSQKVLREGDEIQFQCDAKTP